MNPRARLLDQLRAFAIILMIIFHTAYDLNFFGFYQMNYPRNPYWYALPRFIVFLFLTCVGMGLYEAHAKGLILRKFLKRLSLIVGWSVVISIATYLLFPDRWIYFGTLHCIALASLVTIPFLRYPKIALVLGLILVISDFIFGFRLPWFELPHPSMDYIPLFPWWGFSLIGVFIAWRRWDHFHVPSLPLLEWAGKHSLMIYIVHQPLLFGLCYGIHFLLLK